jgi:hypothetical protein
VSPLPWRQRRQALTAAELRTLESQTADAINRGNLAEAEAVARAVMDAHTDASPTDGRYLTVWTSWAGALQRLGRHSAAAREYTTMIDTAGRGFGHDQAWVMLWRIKRATELDLLGAAGQP